MSGLLERLVIYVLFFPIWWPIFRLILEAVTLFSYVLSLAFFGKPGPLADMSIVLMLIRRHRNRRARKEARSRCTPPPPPRTVSATVTEKRIKAKRYHGEKRSNLQYHAAFRLADGREVWLSLNEKEYRRLSQGGRGTLAFREKEKLYLSFQADAAK